jgi:hypothetical protein
MSYCLTDLFLVVGGSPNQRRISAFTRRRRLAKAIRVNGWARESQPFRDMGEEELPREGPATASFSQRLVNGPLTS